MKFKDYLQNAKDEANKAQPKSLKTKKEMDAQQNIDDQLAKSRVLKKSK